MKRDWREQLLKEKNTRYCAKCRKSNNILYSRCGKVAYCKICHYHTKNGKILGQVILRYGITFKNDFARHLLNDYHTPIEYFSVDDIIGYLRLGIMQIDKLPSEVAKAVREEIERTGIDLKRKLRKSKKYFIEQMQSDEFSLNDIIDSLRFGFLQMDKLPPEIANEVRNWKAPVRLEYFV